MDRSSDRFTGKPWSTPTGLYYYGSRWYDPSMGRFVSLDPDAGESSNPQSLNRYVYALNNPLMYVDPDGSSPTSLILKAAFGFAHFLYRVERSGGEYTKGSGLFLLNPDDYNLKFHTIFVGTKGERFSKFDFPSVKQPYYHLVFGKEGKGATHIRLPEPVGELLQPFFDHPEAMSKTMLVLGAAVSTYNIWTAYQDDSANGGGEYRATKMAATKELFSWGGAIVGAEAGAAIGTAIFQGLELLSEALRGE